jgi:NitT/TauT family transport system permease protein
MVDVRAQADPSIADPRSSDLRREASPVGAAQRRRRRLVRTLQVLILVAFLGMWEGSARLGLIDPFFFSMPTQIVARLVQWFTLGTAQGSI